MIRSSSIYAPLVFRSDLCCAGTSGGDFSIAQHTFQSRERKVSFGLFSSFPATLFHDFFIDHGAFDSIARVISTRTFASERSVFTFSKVGKEGFLHVNFKVSNEGRPVAGGLLQKNVNAKASSGRMPLHGAPGLYLLSPKNICPLVIGSGRSFFPCHSILLPKTHRHYRVREVPQPPPLRECRPLFFA